MNTDLILRSIAKRCVSKDGTTHGLAAILRDARIGDARAPPIRAPQDEVGDRFTISQLSPPIWKDLISRYSSMPYFEPSRPMPDCLMPPKGATSSETEPVLSPTMPNSNRSATRQARLRF